MRKYHSFLNAPPKVRKRYITLKYGKYATEFGRFISRIKLTFTERKNIRVLDNALETMIREATRANKHEYECVKHLMNMGLFYVIADKDIQSVKIDALTHPNPWKRNLALRIILLTIYEWDMSKFQDKKLKESLIQAKIDVDLQNELFDSLRIMRKAQEKAAKILHKDRNSIIAHRDSNALLQIKYIENISTKKVFSAASDFYRASDKFITVLPKVIINASSIPSLLSQISAKEI